MNVIDTVSGGKEITYTMRTFTIDAENNITVHASRKTAKENGLPSFASDEQFADLISPDNKRLVEIWNSLPGVKPVTKFANRKVAAERIWKAIQTLGENAAAEATAEPEGEATPIATQPEIAGEQPVPAEAASAESGAEASEVAQAEAPIATEAPTEATARPRRTLGRRWRTVARRCARAARRSEWEHPREEDAQGQESGDAQKRRGREVGIDWSARGQQNRSGGGAGRVPRSARSWPPWAGRSTPSAGSWPAR
jgi:hypothetical protein